MSKRQSKITDLRDLLSKALQSERFNQALQLYKRIEIRKPDEPRWAHRKGDLLRRMGRDAEAVIAYERAAHLYSAKGFDAPAAALAKLVMSIDPGRGDVLEWVDTEAERRSERDRRRPVQFAH